MCQPENKRPQRPAGWGTCSEMHTTKPLAGRYQAKASAQLEAAQYERVLHKSLPVGLINTLASKDHQPADPIHSLSILAHTFVARLQPLLGEVSIPAPFGDPNRLAGHVVVPPRQEVVEPWGQGVEGGPESFSASWNCA